MRESTQFSRNPYSKLTWTDYYQKVLLKTYEFLAQCLFGQLCLLPGDEALPYSIAMANET